MGNDLWKRYSIPEGVEFGHIHEGERYIISIKPEVCNTGECGDRLYAKVRVDKYLGKKNRRTLKNFMAKKDVPVVNNVLKDTFLLSKNDPYSCFVYNVSRGLNKSQEFAHEMFDDFMPKIIEHRKNFYRY